MTNNNNKYQKYTPQWENKIIWLVGGKKTEKALKKDEVKPDGSLVTASEEKIKTNEVELLLGKVKRQREIIKTKKSELGKKQKYGEEAKQILKEIKELNPQVKEWDKFASWFESAYQKFLNGGIDGYGAGNVGWKVLLDNYLKSKYKKVANTSPSETNNATATEDYGTNLYQFSTRTETDSNQISYWKVTENEVVKLITRTVKELGEIDYAKFVAYSNANAHPLSTGTDLDKAEYTAAKLQGYLKAIQDRAKCLVDNKIKTEGHPDKGQPANGKRVEYSFGHDFTKFGTDTPQDSGQFTEVELIGLFRLAKAFADATWSNHADFKTATANVSDDTLIVLPAKSSPMTKSDFGDFTPEDLGISVDSSGKSNFYATDYGTKVDSDEDEEKVEYSWDTQKELKIEQGISGWTKLINGIGCTQLNDYTNRQKLISSFTSDPIRQLFQDIRAYTQKDNSLKTDKDGSGTATPDYGCFGSGATDRWTYHDFPDHHIKEESRLNSYEAEKASLLEGVKNDRESQKSIEKEFNEAKKELTRLKKELDNKIGETLTAKRKELKEKFKVSDTEANDFTGNNRLTLNNHFKLWMLVKQIRFLVNFDEEQPTGQINEDNAYQASQDIWDKANGEFWRVDHGWINMHKTDDSSEVCQTDEERIKAIKESKENSIWDINLNYYYDKFVELEKIIILEDWQIEAKKKLKAAIDNQTTAETLADWQSSLKKYDAGLESIFTETKMTKWKEKKDGQTAFDTLLKIKSLLEKVCTKKTDGTIEKVEEGFTTYLKKKDDKLESLSKLIEQKDPVEVIKLITYYTEYDKLSEADKKIKKQKLVWTLKKKDDKGKYSDDADLTEEEITNTLYEIAIGKTALASQKETDSNDNNSPNDDPSTQEGKGAIAWLNRNYWWPVWVPLVIGGAVMAYFWKQISEWWNGPAEEEGVITDKTPKDDDE